MKRPSVRALETVSIAAAAAVAVGLLYLPPHVSAQSPPQLISQSAANDLQLRGAVLFHPRLNAFPTFEIRFTLTNVGTEPIKVEHACRPRWSPLTLRNFVVVRDGRIVEDLELLGLAALPVEEFAVVPPGDSLIDSIYISNPAPGRYDIVGMFVYRVGAKSGYGSRPVALSFPPVSFDVPGPPQTTISGPTTRPASEATTQSSPPEQQAAPCMPAVDHPEFPIVCITSNQGLGPSHSCFKHGLIAAMWRDGTVIRIKADDSALKPAMVQGWVKPESVDQVLQRIRAAYPEFQKMENRAVIDLPSVYLTLRLIDGCHSYASMAIHEPSCVFAKRVEESPWWKSSSGAASRAIAAVRADILSLSLIDEEEIESVSFDTYEYAWQGQPIPQRMKQQGDAGKDDDCR